MRKHLPNTQQELTKLKPPRKIGFVFDDSLDKTDGVQQYILGVGEWLRAQGHDVHYLVSTSHRQDVANIHSLARNVTVRFNGNRLGMPLPASKRQIRALLQREQFDVLHIQLPFSPLFASKVMLAAPSTTAVVGTFHIALQSRLAELAARGLYYVTWRAWRRLDAVYSVSTAAQDLALRVFKAPSDVVPNVIDFNRFSTAQPFDKTLPTLVFLGRLVPRKGCQVLLEAVERLQKANEVPAFRVLVCGRGPLEAELKAYVAREALNNITFTGFVSEDDKVRYLATADVAIFPSSGGESFGIVLLEAMASGSAAVLAGDNPGYHSVMQDRPELLFTPTDSRLLAKKLTAYLTDEPSRLAAAAWGKNHAATFDVNIVGAELINRYNKALRQRRNV